MTLEEIIWKLREDWLKDDRSYLWSDHVIKHGHALGLCAREHPTPEQFTGWVRDQEYETVGGNTMRVICTDAPSYFPLICVDTSGGTFTYTKTGKESMNERPSKNDLIPPAPSGDAKSGELMCLWVRKNSTIW